MKRVSIGIDCTDLEIAVIYTSTHARNTANLKRPVNRIIHIIPSKGEFENWTPFTHTRTHFQHLRKFTHLLFSLEQFPSIISPIDIYFHKDYHRKSFYKMVLDPNTFNTLKTFQLNFNCISTSTPKHHRHRLPFNPNNSHSLVIVFVCLISFQHTDEFLTDDFQMLKFLSKQIDKHNKSSVPIPLQCKLLFHEEIMWSVFLELD